MVFPERPGALHQLPETLPSQYHPFTSAPYPASNPRTTLPLAWLLSQVVFPERPGSLRGFLDVVSPAWNVTLFHYRNTGNRESSVLLGVQVGMG